MKGGSFARTEPKKLSDEEHRVILKRRLRAIAARKPKVVVLHMGINDLRSLARRGESPQLWFELLLEACSDFKAMFKGNLNQFLRNQ